MSERLKSLIKKNKHVEQLCRKIISIKPFAKRCSKDFWDYYNLLNSTEYLDINKVRELQFENLKSLLNYAYKNSPFYKNLYDTHGVVLSQIQSFEDFVNNVPIVTKEMIKEANNITVPTKGMRLINTSGTTGSPFQFYIDPAGNDKELAAIFYQWKRIGFLPGDYRIELRGYQEEPIIEYPDQAVVRFSIVNMEKNISAMVDYINKSRIKFIHGYPSAIYKFVLLIKKYHLAISHPLKGIMLASENVYDWQVNMIKDAFKDAAIIAHYGNTEKVALGAWCEKSNVYHFIPLYGYVEQGSKKELIGTGFINRVTPLIRYRMTDTLDGYNQEKCLSCQRTLYPNVEKIGGRMEEYLVTENDELIPPAVVTFPFKHLNIIQGIQIIQLEDKNVILNYLCDTNLDVSRELEEIKADLSAILGSSLKIEDRKVSEIPMTDSCKFKWIISKVKY